MRKLHAGCEIVCEILEQHRCAIGDVVSLAGHSLLGQPDKRRRCGVYRRETALNPGRPDMKINAAIDRLHQSEQIETHVWSVRQTGPTDDNLKRTLRELARESLN